MQINIVPPHRKVSREVTLEDMPRVLEARDAMHAWMMSKYSCVGLAHPQIDDTDPLAFFITHDELIINPKIISRSPLMKTGSEGCMTYPERDQINKSRHVAIVVEYQVYKHDKLKTKTKNVNGFQAVIYQHEIDHLNGVYCYDQTID